MLVDTNILVRVLQPHHPLFGVTTQALQLLPQQGRELHVFPQNLIELWTVATRPLAQNGLGLNPTQAAAELARLKSIFLVLPETAAIYPAWEALVTRYQVSGKPSHDARLVAAMQVYGLRTVLTFDKSGFSRFPGIEIIDPAEVKMLRE